MKRRKVLAIPLAVASLTAAEKAFSRPDPLQFPNLNGKARGAPGAASTTRRSGPDGFRKIEIAGARESGRIRSLQGVNGTPMGIMPGFPDLNDQYRELGVDFVRIHDLFGPGEIDSGYVPSDTYNATCLGVPGQDGQNAVVAYANPRVIFPDPTANPQDPRSYNFAATDSYLKSITAVGAKILFRIGRSQAAGSTPPMDTDKYAEIIRHVVMHYNAGWNDGYIGLIKHWEIWNEPDLGSGNWAGTPQQYYELYAKVAKVIKEVDPSSNVGGPGLTFAQNTNSSNNNAYEEQFIKWLSANHVPLDFFSYHCYPNDSKSFDPYDFVRLGSIVRALLDENGLPNANVMLTEWNLSPTAATDTPYVQNIQCAAFVGAALTYMQDSPIDYSFFYRGDAAYLGLFRKSGAFSETARAFQLMGKMQETPRRLATSGGDTIGFSVLAGISDDRNTLQVLISNYQRDPSFLNSTLPSHPQEAAIDLKTDPNSALNRRYFGGISPNLINNKNDSHSGGIVVDTPTYTTLTPQDYTYLDNQGFSITVTDLPWGKAAFTIERYRLDASGLQQIDRRSGGGGKYSTVSSMAPPSVELIVLKKAQS